MLYSFVLAVTFATASPPDGASRTFPYDVHVKTLPNGLDIYVVPMQSPGVVACYTWMSVGSRDEVDAGRTGFAHFFEHLMFYGTPNVGREQRESEILALGVDENAWTWFDETVYHGVLARDRLPRFLELEADRFQNLTLTEEDVRRESGAVYGEFRKGQADPETRLLETLYATAFTTHTYRHDTIGYEADIAEMPTAWEYAQSFFEQYYRPENAAILVVGDAKPDEVFGLVEQHWSTWAAGRDQRPPIPVEPEQTEARRVHVDWPTPTGPILALGWHSPAERADNPDIAALELASQLLLSPVGPLHRRLVEEEGLAYALRGGRDTFVDPGLFTVIVDLKDPSSFSRAEQIVKEELERVRAGVDQAYLDATRSRARYGFLTALDDPDTVAYVLGSAVRRNGNPDAIDTFYANYDAQTPLTVGEAMSKYLVDARMTVVTLSAPSAEGTP